MQMHGEIKSINVTLVIIGVCQSFCPMQVTKRFLHRLVMTVVVFQHVQKILWIIRVNVIIPFVFVFGLMMIQIDILFFVISLLESTEQPVRIPTTVV